ncbi:MAG TPA: HAD family phosphatase [Solirubrobacteraceae bacterium]|nr:HAD family phosphatase [Solirubrobacteraceae bacterium]
MALPAAVIFDNDGLLLDTEQAWTRAEVVLFGRRGRAFTADHKRYMLGSSPQAGARKLEEMLELPGQGTALHEELEALVMEEVGRGAPAMPGAPELVAELRERGVPVGLASNSKREFVDCALRHAGMDELFDASLAGDEVAHPKPAPDIYLGVAERLGVAPADCVALEDSHTGVAAARAAGMLVIGVPSFPGVELPEADIVAASLLDARVHETLGLRAAA